MPLWADGIWRAWCTGPAGFHSRGSMVWVEARIGPRRALLLLQRMWRREVITLLVATRTLFPIRPQLTPQAVFRHLPGCLGSETYFAETVSFLSMAVSQRSFELLRARP